MDSGTSAWFWASVQQWQRRAIALILILFAAIGLGSCDRPEITTTPLLEMTDGGNQTLALRGRLSEVSPPETLQALKPFLAIYEPQVQIRSPREGETLTDTRATVRVQVQDLPLYKDPDLALGPHFHLMLDDQPGQDIYDADATITFTDLAPGTHTLRAFAAQPWHESFKNEGAFDQVTFNVFTTSSNHDAGHNAPLLTYSQPQGVYGAEPILLDFYLTNVPLHLIATEDDSLRDWRIRCTVNGESFVFDRWQPLYLKGFNPGQNWVKLELIDETGQLFPGPFNSAIGVVEYRPDERDPLSTLIRGEVPIDIARVLVDPTYEPPASSTSPETPLDTDELSTSEPAQQRQEEVDRDEDTQPDGETQQELVLGEPDSLEPDSLETETLEKDLASPMPQAEITSSDNEASPEPLPLNSTTPAESQKTADEQDSEAATAQNEFVFNSDTPVEPSTEQSTELEDVSDLLDALPADPVEALQDTPAVEAFKEAIESAPVGEPDGTTRKSTTELDNPNDSATLVPDANRPGLSTLVE